MFEIERKFLVKNDNWRKSVNLSTEMQQGYIVNSKDISVRIRIEHDQATLTFKSSITESNLTRREYEFDINLQKALNMLETLTSTKIIKTRHYVWVGNHKWEIDEFAGDNCGLIIAELELEHEDALFDKPDWVGNEVTEDSRYLNAVLINNPYKDWK